MPRRVVGITLVLFLLAAVPAGATLSPAEEKRLQTLEEKQIELRLMRETLAEQTATILRLEQQVAQLTGALDELRHRLKDLDKLAALDARLTTLEARSQAPAGGGGQAAGGQAMGGQDAGGQTGDQAGGQTVAGQTGGDQAGGQTTPPTTAPPKVLTEKDAFAAAKDLFKAGKMDQARAEMQKFNTDFPASNLVPSAIFWIGETYYRQNRFEEAILEYQKVIHDHPKAGKVPSALLKQAFAFRNLKDATSARLLLKRLIKDYPKSPQANVAASILKKMN